MKFILFVIDGLSNTATGSEMQDIDAFNDNLQANGNWIYAAGIGAPSASALIDNRLSAGSIAEGSLFSGPEHYSGFWLIQAADMAEAKLLAAEGSKACNRRVELRPFLGN